MNDNDNALDARPANIPPPTPLDSISGGDPNFDILTTSPAQLDIQQTVPAFDIASSQESTRAKIALYFTYFFIAAIMIAFIGPFIVGLLNPELLGNPLDVSKNLVTEVASVLGGPVG